MALSFRPTVTPARLENRERSQREVQARAETLLSYPRFVIVELTRVCNLSCAMCAGTVLPQAPDARAFHMRWELFEEIADTLFPTAEVVDLRGQGESLLYPKLVEALERTAAAGCQPKLYTNLTAGAPRLLEALMATQTVTAVSFDGSTAEVFEQIRRRSSYPRVVENLRQLVAARDRLGVPRDYVYLSCTAQRANLHQLGAIVQLAGELGIGLVKFFARVTERQGDPESPFQHLEAVRAGLARATELGDRLGVTVELGTTLHPDLTVAGAVIRSCPNPWTNCYLTWEGGMGFCHHLTGVDQFLTGRWDAGHFERAWNSEAWQEIRRGHGRGQAFARGVPRDQTDFFKDCSWCHSLRYSDVEHLLRPEDEASRVRLTRK